MTHSRDAEVAIVGGGPAGAAVAIRLAAAGMQPILFERLPAPRWRASGVYSSSLTRHRLRDLGLPGDDLARLIRPIARTTIETADGAAACVLEHEPEAACGVDRVRLEQTLLEHARRAGAEVREGATVRRVVLDGSRPRLLVSEASGAVEWTVRLVVGADGPSSLVARSAGVALRSNRFRRAAVTGHRRELPAQPADTPATARMVIGAGWYLGIAPVPGGRVNLGLVIGEDELRRQLARGGGLDGVVEQALRRSPPADRGWALAPASDRLTAQLPLVHRVSRASGDGFLLVGDAAGFIDPLSGEGLHRALLSAAMAGRAIAGHLRGDRSALADYDRRLRARFRSKDVVSWVLQLFLFRPSLAGYALRRLDRRPAERRVFADTLADRVPATSLLDPALLVRLLAP